MYGHQVGEMVNGMNLETVINIYIYILLCIKQAMNENLLHSSGNSVLYGDLNGKEIQKRGNIWLIHFAVQPNLTQHCKATISQ